MIIVEIYEQNKQEEILHLKQTIQLIKKELENQTHKLSYRKEKLMDLRKDMWENTVHFTNDFTKLSEMTQYLTEINNHTKSYINTWHQIKKYEKMIGSPYFGMLDFMEDGKRRSEKIYIGLGTVMDYTTYNIYVYDWRAPISSIYYQYELGEAAYNAPSGVITGKVLLKRQYKIQDSKLKYFFDCSVIINDEMLQDILGQNSSPKMRNIVETIQKEQDIIIRNTESDLLIVQGIAGSGKTSIALHRVAFLLYEGLNSRLSSNNVMILSPNNTFSNYISHVLPELGEENVKQETFDEIALSLLGDRFKLETREKQLEMMLLSQNHCDWTAKRQAIEFKGSREFVKLLNRFLWYYSHRLIEFEDICFDGMLIETKHLLKNSFLNANIALPIARQLQRLENIILDKIHPLQKKRLKKLEKIVAKTDGHQLEIKSFSRLLSIKMTKKFIARLHKITRVHYWELYKMLFSDKALFYKLSQGLELPDKIDDIISMTYRNIEEGHISHEDCAPLLYLKLKIEGGEFFPEIKQMVIDEAQDYYPIQYEIFRLLFKNAKYTILGDINQSIEKELDTSLYDEVLNILNKKKSTKLVLNKGYRSSYDINKFTQKILNIKRNFISFNRHGKKPIILREKDYNSINKAIIRNISNSKEQGYELIAIICKTQQEAEAVHSRLENLIKVQLITPENGEIKKGVTVISSYMAKGLEFDVVILYDVNSQKYKSPVDKKLLYIACTRALHQLIIYHTGKKVPFYPPRNHSHIGIKHHPFH